MSPKQGKGSPKLGEAQNRMNGTAADIAEAKELIRTAFPVSLHGKALNAWWVAHRKLKLPTVSRAENLWKGKARRIENHEMDALRNAAIVRLEEQLGEREAIKERVAALKARAVLARAIPAGRVGS